MPMQPPIFRPAGYRTDAERKRESDQRRGRDPGYRHRRVIYNSKAWKLARREFLALHPYCAACESAGMRPTPATVVDHITPIEQGGAPFDPENFQALCHSCHSRKTAMHDGGYGRRP